MKFEFIDAQKALFPVECMCEQLGESRSGFYVWRERPESARQQEDQQLAEEVAKVHQEIRGTYGSPRVHAEMRAWGRKDGFILWVDGYDHPLAPVRLLL